MAVWAITALVTWLALRAIASNNSDGQPHRISLSWPSISCAAAALMIGFTSAWRVDGAPPLTAETAELNLARHASGFRSLAYNFTTRRVERTDALLATMRIGPDGQRRPVTPPTIFAARDVPAGAYGLHAVSRQPTEGRLIVRAGSTQLPLLSVPARAPENGDAPMILLPIEVRLLTVDADATAARSGPAVEIIRLGPPAAVSAVHAGSARRAAHYETADVFFLDEHAYPEPTGFWVAGGRTTEVILANRGDARDLFVRNVPVDNRVTIDADGDVQELMLSPGEERLVRLPNTHDRPLRVRLASQSGFRPSTTEPGSSDLRYLGVWIEVR
jgi:hypothetical protein